MEQEYLESILLVGIVFRVWFLVRWFWKIEQFPGVGDPHSTESCSMD